MAESTLTALRATVESLAAADGRYRVVGGRRGEEPVPARGLRFESRAAADRAARAAEEYRAALREYDPRLPAYDLEVRPVDGRVEARGPLGEDAGVEGEVS